MSAQDEFDPYLVYRVSGQSVECALWTLAEGERALAIFLTRASAEEFIRAGELGPAWQIHQPAKNDLYQIFRRCSEGGIRYAVLDPDNQQARRLFDLEQVLQAGGQD